MKKRLSLLIFIAVDILVILAVIFITLSTTKEYYKVEFKLDGGVLLSGDLEQKVRFGSNAIPPIISKEGVVFLEWSDSFEKITEDKVIYPIWDFETTFGIEFEVYYNGNYCLVSGCFENISGDVYVGAYYNDRRVLGVKDMAFAECSRISSITLPSGLNSIGSNAFAGCTSLSTVNLPDTLVSIGDNAFKDCNNLESIELPKSLISIGDNAFSNCLGLEKVIINSNLKEIPASAFTNTTGIREFIVSSDNDYYTSIDGNLYSKDGKTLIKYAPGKTSDTFTIPDHVEVIKENAFSHCNFLKYINLPNSLKEVEINAINECPNLVYNEYNGAHYLGNTLNPYTLLIKPIVDNISSIEVHNNTLFIFANAFKDCYLLESITMPHELSKIGDYAFSNCQSLTSIILPNKLVSLGMNAFTNCTNLTSIEIPYYINLIRKETFLNCSKLASVTLSQNIIEIEEAAFKECTELSQINFPNKLKVIEAEAFRGCKKITDVVLPNSLSKIGFGAFFECLSIECLKLPFVGNELGGVTNKYFGFIFAAPEASKNDEYVPNTLKRVEITNEVIFTNAAFYDMYFLEEIYLPKTLRKIETNVFYGCKGLKNVYFDGTADDWCLIEMAGISSLPQAYAKNTYFKNKLDEYYLVESIELTDNVTTLHKYQFYKFLNLKTITLSDNIKEIPDNTFYMCTNLETINIGSKTETISELAFEGCANIQNITISEDNQDFSVHNNNVYSKDFKTLYFILKISSNAILELHEDTLVIRKNAGYKNTLIQKVILNDKLELIEDNAFRGCSGLLEINFPDSLKEIGTYAFASCVLLKTIDIKNNVTSIGEYAFSGCRNLTNAILPNSLKVISKGLFSQCRTLKQIILPSELLEISTSAFASCHNLVSMILPSGVVSIGNTAFSNCISLKNIYIPKTVSIIGRYAFYACNSLTINCEAENAQTNWHAEWNPQNRPVFYNASI